MFKGIKVYKNTTLAEKVAILPSQVRVKIDWLMKHEGQAIDNASIILADLCGVLLGLRCSEFLAAGEKTRIARHYYAFIICLVMVGI